MTEKHTRTNHRGRNAAHAAALLIVVLAAVSAPPSALAQAQKPKYPVPGGGFATAPTRQRVRVFVASSGRIAIEALSSSGPLTLRVWDARGRPVPTDHPASGVYLCRISGPGMTEQDALVAVP